MILDTKEKRLVLLTRVPHLEGSVSTERASPKSKPVEVVDARTGETDSYFITPASIQLTHDDTLYLFPYLFNRDGTPWRDANQFLLGMATDGGNDYQGRAFDFTNKVRRVASNLLDYKIYCENYPLDDDTVGIDIFDLSARRQSGRPTWRYYLYLYRESGLAAGNISQRTGAVKAFYSFMSKRPGSTIDMARVDTDQQVQVYIKTASGGFSKTVTKRGQAVKAAPAAPVEFGYVRDEGEDLRPLRATELSELKDALETDHFKVDERLITKTGLYTGARKQTILTLRMKHLDYFTDKHLQKDNTYKLLANRVNGIDTKFGKNQAIFFPKALGDEIKVFAHSQVAKQRRNKFLAKFGPVLSKDDMYVYLSPEGNCHYMSKSDPRYAITKSRPSGQNTQYIRNKILKYTSSQFPTDFKFHWTRATYALLYYNHIQQLVTKGLLKTHHVIDRVQFRLNHSNRETTENYLKLFSGVNERREHQEVYEEHLFEPDQG